MVPGANVCMLSACILEQDIKLYTFGHDSLIQNNVLLLFFQFERVRWPLPLQMVTITRHLLQSDNQW